ncbi:HD domain-containing protein [Vibrio sp. OCN044]|uniref:HD domain-containing protein n=1 Tax=Vibrio tetraodonis subsp. pristinus TaxID=2695891 RepID=A0A6L8LWD7_9VIBR|nr:HD domain-containing protein [Vibrio tetraodonis]MYM60437.1 HD domain-containing protein [Vibrio tetraodonis subsp. pristinus]
MNRIEKQLSLIMELDQLKSVLRRARVKSANDRLENSAEHSWHVALMAILMQEHANEPVDIARVVKMLLLHDIVEIDAGDTFAYDTQAIESQKGKELAAAKRLFNMLPEDQSEALLSLWCEFEDAKSADAKFAKALDRLIPMLLNYHNGGKGWLEHQVTSAQALTANRKIESGSQALWEQAKKIIHDATEKGWLKA